MQCTHQGATSNFPASLVAEVFPSLPSTKYVSPWFGTPHLYHVAETERSKNNICWCRWSCSAGGKPATAVGLGEFGRGVFGCVGSGPPAGPVAVAPRAPGVGDGAGVVERLLVAEVRDPVRGRPRGVGLRPPPKSRMGHHSEERGFGGQPLPPLQKAGLNSGD